MKKYNLVEKLLNNFINILHEAPQKIVAKKYQYAVILSKQKNN